MCISKLKGMQHRAHCKYYSALHTHLTPGVESKGQNIFSESSHVANHALTHTLGSLGGVKRSNHFFSSSSHAGYQIKGNLA